MRPKLPGLAAQLLLRCSPTSALPLGSQLGTALPPSPGQAARACQGCRRGPIPDFWDCCAQRDGMTHSLAASWEVPMNISQADGASKYLFPRVRQEQHIHKCYKETETKANQTWACQDEPKASLILLYPLAKRPVQALCPQAHSHTVGPGAEITPLPLDNFPSWRWISRKTQEHLPTSPRGTTFPRLVSRCS